MRPDFPDYLAAFCAGYIACREGLGEDDGEAFLRHAHQAFQRGGSQRAHRVADLIRGEMPPDLARVVTDPYVVIDKDREIKMPDGRSLWDHMREWREAPSNTASAD